MRRHSFVLPRSRFKALEEEDWRAVSDALEGSEGRGLDGAAVMEKILGTYTKLMDDDAEDLSKCQRHACDLAGVLEQASRKADPDMKEHVTNIVALCKMTPLPEETTLEGPLHLRALWKCWVQFFDERNSYGQ